MNIGPIIRAMKHNRTRVVLIVLEIALTLAIVTNCVNVILSERAKMSRSSGFDDDNLLRINTRPFGPEFQQPGFLDMSIDGDVRRIKAIPGVRAVANTSFQLWEGGGSSSTWVPAGANRTDGPQIQNYYATSDIVEALGMKLTAGRPFRESDHGVGTAPDPINVALITKDAAEALFPGQNVVGKAIQRPGQPGAQPVTIVGVIEEFYNPWGMDDGSNNGPSSSTRALFLPARVGSVNRGVAYLVRTEPGAMESVIAAAEKQLAAGNANRVIEFETVTTKKGQWFSGSKIVVTTMTCIIVALVVVTALGLLGLTSLAVAERTKQIGTRRALGATRSDILRHFLIENWLVTTAGLLIGVFGTYALNVLLVSKVSDTKMPWQLVAAGMVLLWINGLLATLPPALRATHVPPSIATRSV
ncbi:MAG: FtsX-like permease family protein [Thermoanaerobaculia bacterium]